MTESVPRSTRWLGWSRYLLLAVMLHLLLAGGLFFGAVLIWKGAGEPLPAPLQLAVFELVPAPPASPPHGAGDAAPPESPAGAVAPQAAPPAVRVAVQGADTEFAPAREPRAADIASAAIRDVAEPQTAQADTGSAAAPTPVQEAAEPAADGVVDPNATQAELWEQHLLAHLDRLKRYPVWAQRRGQEDVVQVQVRVDRNGQVVERRIVGGRGYPLLDGEALNLLARASPLPPPPPEVADRDLEFRVPIEFFIDQRVAQLW